MRFKFALLSNLSECCLIMSSRVLFCPLIFQSVDLMYFLLIMVVFFLAYGIAQQAILFPQLDLPSWSMASRVFFRPYFQAHGELFMDAPDISKYCIIHERNNLYSEVK